jgi:hypothetical protein
MNAQHASYATNILLNYLEEWPQVACLHVHCTLQSSSTSTPRVPRGGVQQLSMAEDIGLNYHWPARLLVLIAAVPIKRWYLARLILPSASR